MAGAVEFLGWKEIPFEWPEGDHLPDNLKNITPERKAELTDLFSKVAVFRVGTQIQICKKATIVKELDENTKTSSQGFSHGNDLTRIRTAFEQAMSEERKVYKLPVSNNAAEISFNPSSPEHSYV